MKKTVVVTVLCMAALLVSCRHEADSGYDPLPKGVHILGVPAGEPYVTNIYYWSGGSRASLDLDITGSRFGLFQLSDGVIEGRGFPIPQLTVSGGKVLVNYPGMCYWLNGVCHPLEYGIVNDLVESAEIIDGEVCVVNIDEFSADIAVERVLFHDGVISSFTTKDGITYSVGCYGEKPQACYWIDDERHDLDGYGWATSIYVEE